MSKQEEIKKAVDKIVDEVLETEPKAEETKVEETKTEEAVEKAMPKEKTPENGGKDSIKSGTPMTEKKELQAKKDKKVKKSEDEEEKKEEKVEKTEETKATVQKSIEELASVLSEDELELIKAWRAESTEEKEETKEEEVTKSLSSIDEKFETLTKTFEEKISEKDELIKSMNEKIEKMANQPAYDKRSVETLEALEKSDDTEPVISKAQVLETMLNMQLSGKGINSVHIAEMEATGNVSDPRVKQAIEEELKNKK